MAIPKLELPGEVLGRVIPRKLAEIASCADASDQQVKGYGAHLTAHLKEYVRATSPVMHFLTCADNYATGYFQKQGSTNGVTFEKSIWMGCIKDYEGSTLMQSPRIRYLEAGRMLLEWKEAVKERDRRMSNSHIIHRPPQQWAKCKVTAINLISIPATGATSSPPAMDELAQDQEPHRGLHFTNLRCFLFQVRNHDQA
ncbi:hypothetical protein VUR80DRAFT_2112 [Thermomyces stellatus]